MGLFLRKLLYIERVISENMLHYLTYAMDLNITNILLCVLALKEHRNLK